MENLKTILKKEETAVIDVREPWEYASGHLPKAINIPLNDIPGHLNEIKKMTGSKILYCRSGGRSGMAVNLLKQSGIKDVYNGGAIAEIQQLIMN
jgi:phage shock protein E